MDCEDGTDEINCMRHNATELALFRKFRFNRVQRQYDNVWLWRDVNIGPHGRYIFNIPVPARPANWMVSAFSMSPSLGFGMLKKAIEYVGVLPFFMNIEMPSACRQGEQIGKSFILNPNREFSLFFVIGGIIIILHFLEDIFEI